MLRLLIAGFLIAHGLIHAAIWLPQAFGVRAAADPGAPFDPGYSWLITGASAGGARWLSIFLALVAAIGYVIAGTGLLAHQSWWTTFAVAASAASLALFLLYFNVWLSAAVLIDISLLAWLLGLYGSPAARLGM